ncbi:hypothetical protein SNARM312S_06974 [Streptomyces narbonensis]
MAGVEEVELRVRQVPEVGMGAGCEEEGVTPAQTISVGGRCSRSHRCHRGYSSTLVW